MGARWLQQKMRKMKIRRAYLRQYSSYRIKSRGSSVAKDFGITETWHTLGARGAAAQSTDPIPPTKSVKLVRVNDNTVVLDRVWQGFRHQGLDGFNQIIVRKTDRTQVKLMFSGQEFFFVEEDKILDILRRSIVYNAKHKAMRAFPNKIVWVEVTKLSN